MHTDVQQVVDVVSKANAQAFQVAKQVATINTRAIDQITQQQLALVELALGGSVKQLELLRDTRGYKEYFAVQAELAQEAAQKVLAAARDTVGVLAGVRDELNAVVEKSVEEATTQAKAAAKKAA